MYPEDFKKLRLSNRAKVVLAVIREHSNDQDVKGRFFVPSAYPAHCDMFPGETIMISTGGDAAIIKSLIKKELAEPRNLAKYACKITELGCRAYEALRDDPWVQGFHDRERANQSRLRAEQDREDD